MGIGRTSILLPITLSVALHGVVASVMLNHFDGHLGYGGRPRGPGWLPIPLPSIEPAAPAEPERAPIIRPATDAPDPEFLMGRTDGAGDAVAESVAVGRQMARYAPIIQPGLSLDPVGDAGEPVNVPAEPQRARAEPTNDLQDGTLAFGLPPAPLPVPVVRKAETPPPAELQEPGSPTVTETTVAGWTSPDADATTAVEAPEGSPDPTQPGDRLARAVEAEVQTDRTAVAPPPAPSPQSVAANTERSAPPPDVLAPSSPARPADARPGSPGDPSPQAEIESDAFQPNGSAVVVNGEVRAQFGRAFKSVRPRLTFAAYQDLLGLVRARIAMRITTDAEGYVTRVEMLEPTGKLAIDQPTEVAMYQWWFEPPTDSDGRPRGDVFVFSVTYR